MKAKKIIKISYNGELDTDLDAILKCSLEVIGARWYAQGFDLTNNLREILFDIEVPLSMPKPSIRPRRETSNNAVESSCGSRRLSVKPE